VDFVEKRKFLPVLGIEPRFLGSQARSLFVSAVSGGSISRQVKSQGRGNSGGTEKGY
jgi:hypothetical protein